MNNMSKLLYGLIIGTPMLFGCASGEDGFSGIAGSSSTNIISASNLSVGFSTPAPAVFTLLASPGATDKTTPCSNVTGISGSQTSTITITAADQDNRLVSSGTVYIEVEWGTLDKNQCQLQNGQCSVEWSAHINADILTTSTTEDCIFNDIGTLDFYNAVTVWTYGAEGFVDNDGDGMLSDSENYTDVGEPFLNRNDTGSYDAATDNLLGPDTNGVYDGPNGLYNGPNCESATRADCGGAGLIPISENAFMILAQ